jgi:hypothetical protein
MTNRRPKGIDNTDESQDEFSRYLPPGLFDEEEEKQSNSRRLQIGMMCAGVTVFGSLALMAPFVLIKSPLPYMATPGHKVRRALEHLGKQGHGQQTFVDLGSGDGEAVYQALKAGYDRAIGIELNYTLYALAQFRRFFFWSREERRRSTFLRQDLFNYSLSDADTVMLFGVKPLMRSLSQKIAQECPNAKVLCYRFLLPVATLQEVDLFDAKVAYDREEMRIYESNATP